MTTSDVAIVGEGVDGLHRAAKLARAGASVTYVEHGLRAGAPFLTESFLTPFRFNLGPSLVRREAAAGLPVLEPDPLVAVGSATLDRSPRRLSAGATGWDVVRDAPAGCGALVAALAVLLGIDPERNGSGARVRSVAGALDELVLVAGGNGLVAAALIDEIVAAGGGVDEGGGGSAPRRQAGDGLGICRMFIGLRVPAPVRPAFATAVGFDDERSLRAGLDAVRAGADRPLGFLVSNTHLDPQRPGDALSSVVWQGVLPSAPERPRQVLAAEVLAATGIEERDVVFQLLWLPEETGERLR